MKKKSIKYIVILISLICVSVLIYKSYFEVTNENYYKYLYNSLIEGDVTSNQCLNAWEKYSEDKRNRLDFSTTAQYIYDYKKKRCLLNEESYSKEDGVTKSMEHMSDLITSKELYVYRTQIGSGEMFFYTRDFINDKTWDTANSPNYVFYKLKKIIQ